MRSERLFCWALSWAIASAFSLISTAWIVAFGNCFARAIAIAPLPVPKSAQCPSKSCFLMGLCSTRSLAMSMMSSVSGRGMRTSGVTVSDRSRQGVSPTRYCTGVRLLTRCCHFSESVVIETLEGMAC